MTKFFCELDRSYLFAKEPNNVEKKKQKRSVNSYCLRHDFRMNYITRYELRKQLVKFISQCIHTDKTLYNRLYMTLNLYEVDSSNKKNRHNCPYSNASKINNFTKKKNDSSPLLANLINEFFYRVLWSKVERNELFRDKI